jgi:hypothetical protein
LERVLVAVGAQFLRETTNDTVIGVFRLAIAEAVRAPEVAEALELHGRQAGRAALTAIMTHATARGLLDGHPVELAEQFGGLLWGDLMISLLLRVVKPPNPQEIQQRATDAAAALLKLQAAT